MNKEELLADLEQQLRQAKDNVILLQGAIQGATLVFQIEDAKRDVPIEIEVENKIPPKQPKGSKGK